MSSRSILYYSIIFTSLLIIFFIIITNEKGDFELIFDLNNHTVIDKQVSTVSVSPKEFYDSYKPKELINKCLNNSEAILNKSQQILLKAYNQKYITCTFDATGGIGYQLWRFASLYGLGRDTIRLPYFEGQNLEQMINLKELGVIFPMMHEVLQIKNPPNIVVQSLNYGDDSSEYVNFTRLLDFSEKYLRIRGNHLQSYKYFQNYRNEIKDILKCGPTIEYTLKQRIHKLFRNDTNLKLCAHIRRGKFLQDTMLESKKEFIIPAIDFAYKFLKNNKTNKNISVLLIGDDRDFIRKIELKNDTYNVYIPETQSRGEDMCLGINYCDAMVMTASGSAFGWWMSYLMKSNGPVFYNSQISDNGKSLKDIYDFDLFPEEWNKLTVINGKAIKEEKWWRERIG